MSRPLLTQADRADVFRGLAHPLRRKVLRRLSQGDAQAGDLQAAMRVSGPILSQHLSVLRDANLVRCRIHGRQRIYQINRKTLDRARQWFAQLT